MSELKFRPCNNAEEIFDIANDAYGVSPWSIEMFEHDINSRLTSYLVLEIDACPVAFVAGTLVIDELSISNVAVKTAFQKQGLGLKLMQHWFASFDAGTRALLEVRASNAAAQRMYQKIGFKSYHQRENYYHNPVEAAFLMDYFL